MPKSTKMGHVAGWLSRCSLGILAVSLFASVAQAQQRATQGMGNMDQPGGMGMDCPMMSGPMMVGGMVLCTLLALAAIFALLALGMFLLRRSRPRESRAA